MPIRYSPESVLIPTDPVEILEWAARHIENVGIHQGQGLFDGPGRTVTLACWPRGALEVAAGRARISRGRTYDWEAIRRARADAFRLFAEHLAGHRLEAEGPAAECLHREVIDRWSAAPGRTAKEAAQALRAAADHTNRLF